MIQRFLLQLKYPRIKFSKVDSQTKCDRENSFIGCYILKMIKNSLLNNANNLIIEIDGDLQGPNSLLNNITQSYSNRFYFLDIEKKKLLYGGIESDKILDISFLKQNINITDASTLGSNSCIKNVYDYTSEDVFFNFLIRYIREINLLIFPYRVSCLEFVKKIFCKSEVYFVLLRNNSGGLFSIGDFSIREYIIQLGYVYHSRVDNKHDLFVLSSFVNGFPASSLRMLNTSKLQKYISEPPDSDFTKPR